MVNYEFRYVVKMTNGKEYEIITNFHGKKDVLKYIDSHDYIELFDRKIEEMVAVKSEYVMSVLYKDSKKVDSEGNVDWADREDYLEEENERLERENEQLKKEKKVNRTKASLLTEIEILKAENEKLETQKIAFQRSYKQVYEENKDLKHENKALRLQADVYFDEWQNVKKHIEELKDKLKD